MRRGGEPPRRYPHESLKRHLFYVFVAFRDLVEPPEFFIVPRNEVARFVRERHQKWLATPGRRGRPHQDSDMRHFTDPAGAYRDRWDLLGLD